MLDIMREERTNHNSSGKFVVTVMMLESVMNTTSEKIILVSYSTKVTIIISLEALVLYEKSHLFSPFC